MTVIGEEKRKKGGRVSVTLRVYSPLVFKKKKKNYALSPHDAKRRHQVQKGSVSRIISNGREGGCGISRVRKKKKGFKIVAQNGAVAPRGRSNLALWH